MQVYTFQDSLPNQPKSGANLPLLLAAVDRLNQAIRRGEVPLVSLRGDERRFRSELANILSYAVTDCGSYYYRNSIEEAAFDASHYIGTYSTKIGNDVITLRIEPRWGSGILSYLLQYTTGIYQPPDASANTAQQKDSAAWLLVMLWKSLFNQALRRFHIPKEYRERKTNDRFFRGRLDVARHIRENSVVQSRFACVDRPLTLDTTIGRTLRHIIRLLSKPDAYPAPMRDLAGFDERLAAFGVSDKGVTPAEIAKIRYTRLSSGYRPLMQASLAILRRFGGNSRKDATNEVRSYFIDLAELWENYLLAVLQRHLPTDYRVWSPNEAGGGYLLAGQKRAIRPDILIEKNGSIIAVLDAKFKRYTQIGSYEQGGVSREDLYQMSTYLYHYGSSEKPILGLFVTPESNSGPAQVESMHSNPLHRLGVACFGLSSLGWECPETGSIDISQVRETERAFCEAITKLLVP